MPQEFPPYFGTRRNGLSVVSSNTTFSSLVNARTSCSGTINTNTLSVSSVSGFSVGQRVIIHKTQGTTTTATGSWEVNYIKSVGASDLTMLFPLQNTYQDSGVDQSQVWTWFESSNMTINTGTTLTQDNWDGNLGAITFISITGRLYVPGTIDALGKGYTGGAGAPGAGGQAVQGSSELGGGGSSMSANGSGGGGGKGGGGAGTNGSVYQTNATLSTRMAPGGGGGGGNSNSAAGPAGGNGGGVLVIYAKEVFVPSGGIIRADGQGGSNGASNQGGGGGGGGGCILIKAERIINNGTITALGGAGGVGSAGGDAGGGGAGSVGGGSPGPGGNGAPGGNGSIRFECPIVINTGTITPTPSTVTNPLPWTGRMGTIG